jgi:hypothetical protein
VNLRFSPARVPAHGLAQCSFVHRRGGSDDEQATRTHANPLPSRVRRLGGWRVFSHISRARSARAFVSPLSTPMSRPKLAEKLKITQIPTLILIKDRRPVARLEGRASEPQIQRMVAPYLSKPRTRMAGRVANQSCLPRKRSSEDANRTHGVFPRRNDGSSNPPKPEASGSRSSGARAQAE